MTEWNMDEERLLANTPEERGAWLQTLPLYLLPG